MQNADYHQGAQEHQVYRHQKRKHQWQVSVSEAQSTANSKFYADKTSKDAAASSAIVASEAKSKAEAVNHVDFDKLSKIDQAKAAIYYGLGNMQYFNDKSVSNYPGDAVYSSSGVDVVFVKDMSAGIGSTPYLVAPHLSQVSAAAPVFSYVELGMQADGHRPEGLTYGKVDDNSAKHIAVITQTTAARINEMVIAGPAVP